MKILNRKQAAQRLGLSPNALSCHVYRKNWAGIPKPIKIGNRWKWTEEQIDAWVRERLEETARSSATPKDTKKPKPGRPPKRRSRASCS